MELQRICSEDQPQLVAFAESLIGGRTENQDSYGWKNTRRGYLVTVCDGMGGGPGGKTASSIAVKAIIAGIEEGGDDESIVTLINKAFQKANAAILEAGEGQPSLKGMGSTATLLLISETSAHIAHVGDSRVYQLRGKKKVFRTFDHSVVFEMVQKGFLTEEQARLSAQSNVITRALGVKPEVKVDVEEVSYRKGDRFLLCTDGIHGTMPEKELITLLANEKNPLDMITHDVATFVDNLGKSSGNGHDNLTLAVIELKKNSSHSSQRWKWKKTLMFLLLFLLCSSLTLNFLQYNQLKEKKQSNHSQTEVRAHSEDGNDSIKKVSPDSTLTQEKEDGSIQTPINKLHKTIE